jgi:hypothetical protein
MPQQMYIHTDPHHKKKLGTGETTACNTKKKVHNAIMEKKDTIIQKAIFK